MSPEVNCVHLDVHVTFSAAQTGLDRKINFCTNGVHSLGASVAGSVLNS